VVEDRLRRAREDQERESERRVAHERLRIARELHDTVAHAITTITVQSGTALHLLDARPTLARGALTAIRGTAKTALAEMRATVDLLRGGDPSVPDRDAGLDRLPELVAAVRAAGLELHLDIDPGTGGRLHGALDHAAYRIVQESLTNVLRHAGPRARAHAVLRCGQEIVAIEVADDGVGPGSTPGSGHGLAGMRERAEALGGVVDAGPRPGGGFAVRATLPRGRSR
jgi:signal transduction histidine kinase